MINRRIVAVAVLLLGGLLLAGCGAASAVGSLQDAGFSQVDVSQGSGGTVRVSLGGIGEDQRQAAIVKAEQVIWTKYPGNLQNLTVEADTASHVSSGTGTRHRHVTTIGDVLKRTSTRAQLAQRYGPRDPRLDTADPGPSAGTVWLIFGAIALVVIAVVVLLIVLIVHSRRSARRRRELFAGAPTGPGW